MSYKSILVVVDHSPHAAHRIELALHLAKAHEARVTGLFVAAQPISAVGFDGGYVPDPYLTLQRELEDQARAAQALFEKQAATFDGVLTEWRQQIGSVINTICVNARYHDLVVIGQSDPEHVHSGLPGDLPEAVVMGAGRPVLVIPHAGHFDTIGQRVLIGWDAGREATRAVTDALPFLRHAKQVSVMTIGPKISDTAHGESTGSDIALYLARHHVNVEVKREPALGLNPGNVMLSAATDIGADLIVMGLYGHSRMLELVLGGASRTILQTMTVPVLMSH